ncbi:cytochrome c-type biogenesis protein [Aureimonas jatrophae]|uniref:Cytochrome c-type biogenesis protein n=1 Tax=Aureimonas jatrophae TaxID=1166073 RepID=A0A1H0CRK6_9HYPH|nr:cytochrome c-type biogenesis protein [Aureimonas jatrophae]MBB3949348.1 cytochrome c-type biogenesis protein CcmH [Aureimonas jatrophae]SDN60341.1 cytochrome c-type biogenesis protein CcmH [Aureimonas jatrophae]
MRRALATLALVLSLGGAALAVQPDEVLPDAALEARARGISAELRCMVCQNQSIDDSDAPLAKDLRVLVRQRLQAGDSDDGVRDYLVSRYGQFVLLRPRLEWQTVALWGTPAALLLFGLCLVWLARRGSGAASEPRPLDAGEEAALKRLLERER